MYVYICRAEEKKHDGIHFFSQVPFFTTERSQTRRNTTITDNNNNSFVPIVWTRAGIQTDNLQLTRRCSRSVLLLPIPTRVYLYILL